MKKNILLIITFIFIVSCSSNNEIGLNIGDSFIKDVQKTEDNIHTDTTINKVNDIVPINKNHTFINKYYNLLSNGELKYLYNLTKWEKGSKSFETFEGWYKDIYKADLVNIEDIGNNKYKLTIDTFEEIKDNYDFNLYTRTIINKTIINENGNLFLKTNEIVKSYNTLIPNKIETYYDSNLIEKYKKDKNDIGIYEKKLVDWDCDNKQTVKFLENYIKNPLTKIDTGCFQYFRVNNSFVSFNNDREDILILVIYKVINGKIMHKNIYFSLTGSNKFIKNIFKCKKEFCTSDELINSYKKLPSDMLENLFKDENVRINSNY